MTTTISNIRQNTFANTPNLTDVLNLHKKDIFSTVNCHAIASIQTFNASNQTATATINYQETYFKYDSAQYTYLPYLVPYPVLLDCPVLCLGGGAASLTFPIAKGDECIVFFNDRDLDNWFQAGANQSGSVNTSRKHSMSDGIILVGVRSKPNVLSNYDTTRAVLRNGNAMVGVGPELVKIANGSYDLKTQLQSLISDLQTLITTIQAITVSGTGIDNSASFTPIASTLTTLSTQIGGLLE